MSDFRKPPDPIRTRPRLAGARLIQERECACDEDVVSRGNPPDLYAEAILKVCRWSAESPLMGVAGVTGGNLERRIEQIMTARDVPGLSFAKKAGLAIAAAAVLLAPVLVGLATAPAMLAQIARFTLSPAELSSQWRRVADGQRVEPARPFNGCLSIAEAH